MSSFTVPESLRTRNPAEGRALARAFAQELSAKISEPASMEDHLKTTSLRPSPEWIEAIYFHAIALVNHGWSSSGHNGK